MHATLDTVDAPHSRIAAPSRPRQYVQLDVGCPTVPTTKSCHLATFSFLAAPTRIKRQVPLYCATVPTTIKAPPAPLLPHRAAARAPQTPLGDAMIAAVMAGVGGVLR